mmetsp:Transcript_58956/g.140235  ORF Transcript_58956/g.140235 Transcript_58956/m.140235 type:complete len:221 (+) Transcript_58956:488-1150(+)
MGPAARAGGDDALDVLPGAPEACAVGGVAHAVPVAVQVRGLARRRAGADLGASRDASPEAGVSLPGRVPPRAVLRSLRRVQPLHGGRNPRGRKTPAWSVVRYRVRDGPAIRVSALALPERRPSRRGRHRDTPGGVRAGAVQAVHAVGGPARQRDSGVLSMLYSARHALAARGRDVCSHQGPQVQVLRPGRGHAPLHQQALPPQLQLAPAVERQRHRRDRV